MGGGGFSFSAETAQFGVSACARHPRAASAALAVRRPRKQVGRPSDAQVEGPTQAPGDPRCQRPRTEERFPGAGIVCARTSPGRALLPGRGCVYPAATVPGELGAPEMLGE